MKETATGQKASAEVRPIPNKVWDVKGSITLTIEGSYIAQNREAAEALAIMEARTSGDLKERKLETVCVGVKG